MESEPLRAVINLKVALLIYKFTTFMARQDLLILGMGIQQNPQNPFTV